MAILAFGAAGALYLASLPGVGDAEARMRSILATHGETPGTMPPPARLGRAVIAVEDENFYSNVAIDILDGTGRAAVALLQQGGDPGGSTIGQQLAKNLCPHGGGLGGTLEEIGLAVKLSLHYSKDRILNLYLNSIYYGQATGATSSPRGYFGVLPRRLSWSPGESARRPIPKRRPPMTPSTTHSSRADASSTCSTSWSLTAISLRQRPTRCCASRGNYDHRQASGEIGTSSLELAGDRFELGGRGRFALDSALAHARENRGSEGPGRVR